MPHPHGELEGYKQLYHGMEFHDDVYRRPLGQDWAIRARELEMEFLQTMEVHSKVDRAEAERAGFKFIITKSCGQ